MTKTKAFAGIAALSMGLALSACGGMPTYRGLESPNQPVVERTNYVLDVRSNTAGLSVPEMQRVAGWFDAMDLRYGDRVSIDDPNMSGATRNAVAELAGRHGILLADTAPVTTGQVQPGVARVVITRSSAYVPNCPNWDASSDMNYNNATSPGYGCSVNGNLAQMVANPEDLIVGQSGTGETVVLTGNKAIDSYREAAPTGAGGLNQSSATGN